MKKFHYVLISVFVTQVYTCLLCAGTLEIISRSRPMLHTFVEIKAWGDNAEKAIEEAFAEMERVNSLLNNYAPNSEVSRINQNAGGRAVEISPETMDALKHAVRFCDMTGGALDITIGPLLRLWGFGTDDVGLATAEPDVEEIRRAKSLVDYRALELVERTTADGTIKRTARLAKKGMWIDVGSFSKGFVADKAIAILKKRGIHNALVIAGGTVCALGQKPDGSAWQVGVQHPRKPGGLMSVVSLRDKSISTSGDYEIYYKKKGKRITHIIDPRTGAPVPRLQSASVIALDGMTSDGLDTGLFVLGPEKAIALINSLKGVEALIVSEGGKVTFSDGWTAKPITY
jgi:thiamine biosynthesis lipoprotein